MTLDSHNQPNRTSDELLDLLLDALQQRQSIRRAESESIVSPVEDDRALPPEAPATDTRPDDVAPHSPPDAASPAEVTDSSDPVPDEAPLTRPLTSINLGRTLARLALLVVALVIAINIPFNKFGTTLARALPDTASLIIRDGLVLKGAGSDIYVLQDNKLRWISSLEAFDYFGFRWDEVHVVDDTFLDNFERGKPLHVLLKCNGSPHIYALENGRKRWIKDIVTFENEGYLWQDVKTVACQSLRAIPDGQPIPPDAGAPPQP